MLQNQELGILCSDILYTEVDSPSIGIKSVHTVTELNAEQRGNTGFFLKTFSFHICMGELKKYARSDIHNPYQTAHPLLK